MKRYVYIIIALLSIAVSGCMATDEWMEPENTQQPIVERTEDGRLRVSADLGAKQMSSVGTLTRSGGIAPDENIVDGWCVIFGVDETLYYTKMVDGVMKVYNKSDDKETDVGYGPNSKLLQKTEVNANANGRFYMSFDETQDRVFMRFIINMSDREEQHSESAVSQADADADPNDAITDDQVTLFNEFLNASVGLDGLFDMTYTTTTTTAADGTLTYNDENTTPPDPEALQPALPLTSHGYVLTNGISAESMKEIFHSKIELVRVYSKIEVFSANADPNEANGMTFNSEFEIEEVTLLKGANEGRLRSSILSPTGSVVENFDIVANLGGKVSYGAVGVVTATKSKPIYLYPNSGGDFVYDSNTVNNSDNPTYIVIKGKAKGYSDYGYYKVALKAQYPLHGAYSNDHPKDDAEYWSPLTYDIWRNTRFSVCLLKVDKPGYATFKDATNKNNPANNISYDITVDGTDNRNEYLGSNGTFFVELDTSRIYAKGYIGNPIAGNINFTITPSTDNYHPSIYIYGEGGATISSASYGANAATDVTLNAVTAKFVPDSNTSQSVTVNFTANSSGYVIIRCGDIMKRIPVVYEPKAVSMFGGKLEVDDGDGRKWSDFAYDEIWYEGGVNDNITLNALGVIENQNDQSYVPKSFTARIFPKDGSGFTKLYVRQAGMVDLIDVNSGKIVNKNSVTSLVYQSTGNIYTETLNGLETNLVDVAGNDARTYTVRGESYENVFAENAFYTDVYKNKFGCDGWGDEGSSSFTLVAQNIGTNQYSDTNYNTAIGHDHVYYYAYVNENYKLTNNNSAKVTIYNSAGEGKTYTFGVTQYAKPYCSHGTGICDGGVADRYGDGNHKMVTHTCALYNCVYGNNALFSYGWIDKSNMASKSYGVPHRESLTPVGMHAFVFDSTVGKSECSVFDSHNNYVYNTYQLTLVNDVEEKIVKQIRHGDYSYANWSNKGTKTSYSGKF